MLQVQEDKEEAKFLKRVHLQCAAECPVVTHPVAWI